MVEHLVRVNSTLDKNFDDEFAQIKCFGPNSTIYICFSAADRDVRWPTRPTPHTRIIEAMDENDVEQLRV